MNNGELFGFQIPTTWLISTRKQATVAEFGKPDCYRFVMKQNKQQWRLTTTHSLHPSPPIDTRSAIIESQQRSWCQGRERMDRCMDGFVVKFWFTKFAECHVGGSLSRVSPRLGVPPSSKESFFLSATTLSSTNTLNRLATLPHVHKAPSRSFLVSCRNSCKF